MQKEYASQGVRFLAVSIEQDREQVEALARKIGLQLPVAIAGEGEMMAPLGVRAVPSTIFVKPDGYIIAAATGARDRAFFRRRVKELLKYSRP